jgi:hypothetical protein
MAAMSEEEDSFQESVGGITILESEHLESMDSARVPAMIDVAQEASAHGLSASRSWGVGDSIDPSELSLIARKAGLKEEAASVKSVETAQCYRNALAAIVRAITEKEEAIAREKKEVARANEAVVVANTEREAAVTRANEEVTNANTARDAAVARANEAVVIATTEKEAAVARANEEVVRANTAREELAAREQEIAQIRNAVAVSLRVRTFGEAEWGHYFGDVDSAPPLPSDMAAILDGPCPFWRNDSNFWLSKLFFPNQKVRDTHLLVLIPATVGGVPFTLNLLGELIQHPKHGGYRTQYHPYGEQTKAQIGAASPPRSYWVLMTRTVLPDSRSKTYEAQKEMVAAHAGRAGLPYELPHALEAATAILMHHAREGKRLFRKDPLTYTRCQEVVNGFPVTVGGFSSGGLFVSYHYDVHHDAHGASCLRKF